MSQNLDLEIKVIKTFVAKDKQYRYIQFVSSPKHRHKFTRDLAHFRFFKWDIFEAVNGNVEKIILQTLDRNGIPGMTCYVISENTNIDTKTLDTLKAISETVGYGMGTILVFGDAEVVFFESEELKTRFIGKNGN